MSTPPWIKKQLNVTRETHNPDYPRVQNPGKCCAVYITDDHPRYVAFTRNSLQSLKDAVGDRLDTFVLTTGGDLDIPEADQVIDINTLLDEFGMRNISQGRFPDLIFGKFLIPFIQELDKYDRAICIDPDTIIQDARFADLLDMDFDGHMALASWDPWAGLILERNSKALRRAGYTSDFQTRLPLACKQFYRNRQAGAYCNVGMIVWNLRAMRNEEYRQIVHSIVEFQEKMRFSLPEQDCFACAIPVKPISACYNFLLKHGTSDPAKAIMLHYTGTDEAKDPLVKICCRNGFIGAMKGGFSDLASEILVRPRQRRGRIASKGGEIPVGYCVAGRHLPVREVLFEQAQYKNDPKADYDFAVAWDSGDFNRRQGVLDVVERNKCPLYLCEAGPLWSICPWNMTQEDLLFRSGFSVIADSRGFNYDSYHQSDLETMINDPHINIDDHEIARARKLIDTIVSRQLSKYNHQAITNISTGRNDGKCVLIIDQDAGDESVIMAGGSNDVFQEMLARALAENPEDTILIKTHPIQNAGGRAQTRGALSGVPSSDRIRLITQPINPYSLMKQVHSVYVHSSACGFEALMAGKEVHTFGMPWYAGWGATIDYLKNDRRKTKRTLEELFAFFYLRYTKWYDPVQRRKCTIEEAIDSLTRLRDRYFREHRR